MIIVVGFVITVVGLCEVESAPESANYAVQNIVSKTSIRDRSLFMPGGGAGGN